MKKQKNFYLKAYGLIKNENDALLITQHASVLIKDKGMISFLSNHGSIAIEINEETIKSEFEDLGITLADGINFLIKAGVLDPIDINQQKNSPFDQLILLSSGFPGIEEFSRSLEFDGVKVKKIIDIDEMEDWSKDINPQPRTLIVSIFTEYSGESISEIYRKLSGIKSIGFISGYYMREEFKIDALFMPDFGTPCHFCHYERWINREVNSFSKNSVSWSNVTKMLKGKKIKVPSSIALHNMDHFFALQVLRRRIQNIMGIPLSRIHLDDFVSSISCDIINCTTVKTPLPHWHGCGCHQSNW